VSFSFGCCSGGFFICVIEKKSRLLGRKENGEENLEKNASKIAETNGYVQCVAILSHLI
jgi:hypothetical protein